jgi:hypothetical protein
MKLKHGNISDLSAECRISSVYQTEGCDKTGSFRNASKEFNANSLFCISQALAKYSGYEIKEHELHGMWGTYGGKKNAYSVLVGKPEGKRQPRRPRRG